MSNFFALFFLMCADSLKGEAALCHWNNQLKFALFKYTKKQLSVAIAEVLPGKGGLIKRLPGKFIEAFSDKNINAMPDKALSGKEAFIKEVTIRIAAPAPEAVVIVIFLKAGNAAALGM